MSADAAGWAYRHSPYKGAAFAVHLALADSANDMHGYRLWARQSWIAGKARVSRSTANEVMGRMVADGFLVLIEDNAAAGRPNLYRLVVDAGAEVVWSPDQSARVSREPTPPGPEGVGDGDRGCPETRQGGDPRGDTEPKGDPNQEPKPPDAAVATPADKHAAAKALVDPWWEERRDGGNPVGQPYMACVKVVHSMLGQHVPEQRIAFALRHAPVVSTGALEMAIQRELERRGERDGAPIPSTRERRLASRPGEADRFAEALGVTPTPSAIAGALPQGDDDQ